MKGYKRTINIHKVENHLFLILKCISLPESLYKTVIRRYKRLENWLTTSKKLRPYKPQIFLQGSFKLGTVIYPIQRRFEFDIDLVCALTDSSSSENFSQDSLKLLIGRNLKKYIFVHDIHAQIVEKGRCWTIKRFGEEIFHMDILPCISDIDNPNRLFITDLEDRDDCLCYDEWLTSNPAGYSCWFLKRCRQQSRPIFIDGGIPKLPQFSNKFVLQKIVMILKRHNDVWSNGSPEKKTASVIITTLAAQEYEGENSIGSALYFVIIRIAGFAKRGGLSNLEVINPADENENFADKWTSENFIHFNNWVVELYFDFITNFFRSRRKIRYFILLSQLDLHRRFKRLRK